MLGFWKIIFPYRFLSSPKDNLELELDTLSSLWLILELGFTIMLAFFMHDFLGFDPGLGLRISDFPPMLAENRMNLEL